MKDKTLLESIARHNIFSETKTESCFLQENRILYNGEMVLATDRCSVNLPCVKIGDGKHKYASLPYIIQTEYMHGKDNTIYAISNNSIIGSIRYITKIDKSNMRFGYEDIEPFITGKKFVYVDKLFIAKEYRNYGYGTQLLNEFLRIFTNTENIDDEYIIIIESGLLIEEYLEEPNDELYNKVLSKLDTFFTKRGFSNINNYTNSYEYKELYIYTESDLGKSVVDKIKSYYNRE